MEVGKGKYRYRIGVCALRGRNKGTSIPGFISLSNISSLTDIFKSYWFLINIVKVFFGIAKLLLFLINTFNSLSCLGPIIKELEEIFVLNWTWFISLTPSFFLTISGKSFLF